MKKSTSLSTLFIACQLAENRHPDTDDLGRFQQSSGFAIVIERLFSLDLSLMKSTMLLASRDLYRDLELHLRQ